MQQSLQRQLELLHSPFPFGIACRYDIFLLLTVFVLFWIRDSFGDSTISGDLRWAGTYGVNVDFVARSHCAVEFILVEDMEVSF